MQKPERPKHINGNFNPRDVSIEVPRPSPPAEHHISDQRLPHSWEDPQVEKYQRQILHWHSQLKGPHDLSALGAIHLGMFFISVKEILGHGEFLSWIASFLTPQCRITKRTAQRYMRLAKNRSTLVSRLRKLNTDQNANTSEISAEDAHQLLEAMSIAEATSLLAIRTELKKQVPISAESIRATSIYAALIELVFGDGGAASAQLRIYIGDEFVPGRVEAPALVCPGLDIHNSQCVEQLVDAYDIEAGSPIFLLLSEFGSSEWMPRLDTFPRTRLRIDSPGLTSYRPRYLFAMLASPAFEEFCRATQHLGQPFLPFPESVRQGS